MKKMCHNFSGQFFGQADVVAASLPVMPPAPDVDARQYAARARESAANRRGGNDGSDVHRSSKGMDFVKRSGKKQVKKNRGHQMGRILG